ncbi:hypothetical protein DITRI_Ditri16bG0064500 [Diplodiscus trichospermus]
MSGSVKKRIRMEACLWSLHLEKVTQILSVEYHFVVGVKLRHACVLSELSCGTNHVVSPGNPVHEGAALFLNSPNKISSRRCIFFEIAKSECFQRSADGIQGDPYNAKTDLSVAVALF